MGPIRSRDWYLFSVHMDKQRVAAIVTQAPTLGTTVPIHEPSVRDTWERCKDTAALVTRTPARDNEGSRGR